MRFPGIAYSFMRDTDTAGPTALILSRHLQVSSAAVQLEQFFANLPKDRILVLTNVSVASDPGSGQAISEIAIQGLSQGITNFTVARLLPPITTALNRDLNWQGEVYIQGGGPGTNTVRMFTQFDAGANANLMTVGLHGIIIPRGNMGGF